MHKAPRPVQDRIARQAKKIIRLYVEYGCTLKEIGGEPGIDCSQDAVHAFLIERGVTIRRGGGQRILLPELVDMAVRLWSAGKTCPQLATMLGCCCETIVKELKVRGIFKKRQCAPRQWPEELPETAKIKIAGLINTEGTIRQQDPNKNCHVGVEVYNTEVAVLSPLLETGAGRLRPTTTRGLYEWYVTSAVDVYWCLQHVLPHLLGKRADIARGVIAYLEDKFGFQSYSLENRPSVPVKLVGSETW